MDPSGPLTFDAPLAPAATACAICGQPIDRAYYTVNGQVACTTCRNQVLNGLQARPGLRGWLTSVGIGSAAGFVGAFVWWAVRRFASLEIGLIAIGIGHFVGLGVRRGSGGRGGRGFQLLAVVLTYFWITANYVPDVMQAFMARGSAVAVAGEDAARDGEAAATGPIEVAVALVLLFGVALAAPFLDGADNIIGLIIIAFGLYQAWKLNAAGQVAVEGPFRLAPAVPAMPASRPPPLPPSSGGA